jgi:hypothetical protein
MNLVVSIGPWNERVDYMAPNGESGRTQRGPVFLMWSKPLDPKVVFSLTLSIRFQQGMELKQSIELRNDK